MSRMVAESIKIVGRLGYFKLFNSEGYLHNAKHIFCEGEWRRIVWRFYWRKG